MDFLLFLLIVFTILLFTKSKRCQQQRSDCSTSTNSSTSTGASTTGRRQRILVLVVELVGLLYLYNCGKQTLEKLYNKSLPIHISYIESNTILVDDEFGKSNCIESVSYPIQQSSNSNTLSTTNAVVPVVSYSTPVTSFLDIVSGPGLYNYNPSNNFTVCSFWFNQRSSHFPHMMQQLTRCLSWWMNRHNINYTDGTLLVSSSTTSAMNNQQYILLLDQSNLTESSTFVNGMLQFIQNSFHVKIINPNDKALNQLVTLYKNYSVQTKNLWNNYIDTPEYGMINIQNDAKTIRQHIVTYYNLSITDPIDQYVYFMNSNNSNNTNTYNNNTNKNGNRKLSEISTSTTSPKNEKDSGPISTSTNTTGGAVVVEADESTLLLKAFDTIENNDHHNSTSGLPNSATTISTPSIDTKKITTKTTTRTKKRQQRSLSETESDTPTASSTTTITNTRMHNSNFRTIRKRLQQQQQHSSSTSSSSNSTTMIVPLSIIPRIVIVNRKAGDDRRALLNCVNIQYEIQKLFDFMFYFDSISKVSSDNSNNNNNNVTHQFRKLSDQRRIQQNVPIVTIQYMNTMKFTEQIHFFSNTDIIITPHGAQLTGIMFMPSVCSHIIEIFLESWFVPTFFGTLAITSNIQHSYMLLSNPQQPNLIKRWSRRSGPVRRMYNMCPPTSTIVSGMEDIIFNWYQCVMSSSSSQ